MSHSEHLNDVVRKDSSFSTDHPERDQKRGQSIFRESIGAARDRFWIIVLANLALLGLGYVVSWLPRKSTARDLTNLTVWTQRG